MGEMIEILETPALLKLKEELIERNFEQKYFISRERAEADLDLLIENLRLGRTPMIIEGELKQVETDDNSGTDDRDHPADDIFR